MDTTMLISLGGHAEQYRLDASAYDRLERYLDGAAAGLRDNPDRAEILADLERAVSDKLAAIAGSGDRILGPDDIDGVLEAVGPVDAGSKPPVDGHAPANEFGLPARRRLRRIRQGQQLAGVCAGIAAYAELRVDWVRTFFVLATVVTAGVFGLVYAALAFILPVADTRDV